MRVTFLSYLRLQTKRAVKVLPAMLVLGALLFAALTAFSVYAHEARVNDPASRRLRVGIAGEEGNPYMTLAGMALKNDSISSSAEILRVTEAEAQQMIRAGDLDACVILPEGFFEAIGVGEHKQIRYLTSPYRTGIGRSVMRGVASSISKILLACENSIYGVQKFISDNGLDRNAVDESNVLILRYFTKALDRDALFETVAESPSGGLSADGHTVLSAFVFIMMIWGGGAFSLYRADSKAVRDFLAFSGLSPVRQACAGLILHTALCTFGLIVPAMIFAAVCNALCPGAFEAAFSSGVFAFVLRVLAASAVFSAASYFFYTAAGNGAGGLLLHAFFGLTVGYLSGCFYPITFFSPAVRAVFSLLPGAAAIRFISSFDLFSFFILLFWLLLFASSALVLSGVKRGRRAA
ncbi:MAG: ABC transporter permease [Clostridia bacterium]|nr:ABC transporter permease [Clostridia bacterium]